MDNVLAHLNTISTTGYVLGPCNVSVEGNVTYLPVYMAGMFHNE